MTPVTLVTGLRLPPSCHPRGDPPSSSPHLEVVATQPTKADRATLAMFESTERKTLPGAAYIVKVELKTETLNSAGWITFSPSSAIKCSGLA